MIIRLSFVLLWTLLFLDTKYHTSLGVSSRNPNYLITNSYCFYNFLDLLIQWIFCFILYSSDGFQVYFCKCLYFKYFYFHKNCISKKWLVILTNASILGTCNIFLLYGFKVWILSHVDMTLCMVNLKFTIQYLSCTIVAQ